MQELARLLNAMCADGVIEGYALFCAAAQMRYTEPIATLDADVVVAIPRSDRIDVQGDIAYCAARGYRPEGEAIRVGAWPTQFIPVFDSLTREAMAQAETADFDGVPFRVVQAVHLAVIALSVGRAKHHARIPALLESGSVSRKAIEQLANRHGLLAAWRLFETRFPLDETESRRLLDRQARWQKSLRDLSWPENIRMAEDVRDSVRQMWNAPQGGAADNTRTSVGSKAVHPDDSEVGP